MSDRKFVLTKLAAGDYLLPGNDGASMWRLAHYTDGPSLGLDLPRDRTYWGVWRWNGPLPGHISDEWDNWEMYSGALDTRAEAIREVVRMSGGAA